MTFLEIALNCVARGWHVFPCWPGDKRPLVKGGFLSATDLENEVRAWWTKWPDANVAIATGASGLTVLDCDHGLADEAAVQAFTTAHNLPETYTVRTGRRRSLASSSIQRHRRPSIAWVDGEHSGDIRGTTGYVMAAGCVHPSGERYELLWDAVVAAVPEYVRSLTPAPVTGKTGTANPAVVDDGGPISDHRNVNMISLFGRRNEGADDDPP